jgi:hypothetical protein
VKKVLLFLAIFLVGMLLLRLFSGPGTSSPGPLEPTPEEPWAAGDGTEAVGLTPRGRLKVTRSLEGDDGGRRPTELVVEAMDSGPSDDGAELFLSDVELRYLDPKTMAVRMGLDAKRATMARIESPQTLAPKIADRVVLETVALKLLEGAPVVPLEVRTQSLAVDLAQRSLSSSEPIELVGPALSGKATGLFFDEPSALLRLERAVDVSLASGARVAVLRSAGSLEVERLEQDPLGLFLRARTDAHLLPAPAGEDPDAGLRGDEILLRLLDDGTGNLSLSAVDATGSVRYRHGASELTGKTLHAEFEDDGGPRHIEARGAPRARLELAQLSQAGRVPAQEATILSEELLELDWKPDGIHVRAAGPARIVSGGAQLSSDGDILGIVDPLLGRAHFTSDAGVRLEYGGSVLVTREMRASVERDAEGRSVFFAEARGRPLLTGTMSDGRQFVVSSEELLSVRQQGDHWTVPRAERVELTVLGSDGFRARAAVVEGLDPRRLALSARGAVEVESAEGLARGAELVVQSPEDFTLAGTPEEKATFDGPNGRAEALLIVRSGESLTLRGEIVAHLAPTMRPGEVYDFGCDELVLTRSGEALEGTGARRGFQARALGLRDAVLKEPDGTLELSCAELFASFEETLDAAGSASSSATNLSASGVTRAELDRPLEPALHMRLACDTLEAHQSMTLGAGEPLRTHQATARGAVAYQGQLGELPFTGTADELSIDGERRLRASAAGEGRVLFEGVLPSNQKPFALRASWVEASPEHVKAHLPEIEVQRMQAGVAGEADVDVRATAQSLEATPTWLELDGEVHVEGISKETIPWVLDAGRVRFDGTVAAEDKGTPTTVSGFFASRGVTLALPERHVRAMGETLRAGRLTGLMRLEGVPARVEAEAAVHEAEWIEVDINLGMVVATGQGRIRPPEDGDWAQEEQTRPRAGNWTIDYGSLQTLLEPDALIFVLQEPRVRYEGEEVRPFLPLFPAREVAVRASWAILWIDRESWERLSPGLDGRPKETEEPTEAAPSPSAKTPKAAREPQQDRFFDRLRRFGVIREAYLEGPIEVEVRGQPSAFASAAYFDVEKGTGWLADASFTLIGELFGLSFKQIKVQARWLRQVDDSTFHADSATVSLCEFEEPHMLIKTGDLRITRSLDDEKNYNVRMHDNSIRVYDLFTLPLPSIDYSSDRRGKPILSTLQLGSSARFGSFVSAGFARPATGTAKFIHGLLGRTKPNVDVDLDSEYSVRGSWLGSRGVMLDLGLEVGAEKEYRWLTEVGGVPDQDDDKGYIRVPRDERETLRVWARSKGRYWIDEAEWLDLAATYQTDPGVQSEFFESDFERYERSETYLRWRRARELHFVSANVMTPTVDFFSAIEELPALRGWRARAELARLGRASLVYSADASAAYLRRKDSEGDYASPFGLPADFPDGLGEREALRFDTTQRLELPVPLGIGGLRATPFLLGRFSAWSEDTLQEDEPLRALGQGGLRLQTALWKLAAGGGTHQLAPYVQAAGELAREDSGGDPVSFDEVEEPVGGDTLDVGLRGRFLDGQGQLLLDVDLRASRVSGVEDAGFASWTELAGFSRLAFDVLEKPVQVFHDGRYDPNSGDTLYSRVGLGLKPTQDLGLELSHMRGLDLDRDPLFEAASIAALYTWTEKWEFEGRQSFSLLEDGDRLSSGLLLRRYGHDIVFEIESTFREDEGASLGISVRPLVSFDRPEVGSLNF